MADLDTTAVLEEVLDLLERRGIRPQRLRVGDIEVDIAHAEPLPSLQALPSAPPADPGLRVHVPLDRQGMYMTPSLWPNGVQPSFPAPKKDF